jgi:sulfur carrier protein ThiS
LESIVTEGPRNYPLVYATEPHIKCAIAYNPFDLTDISKHELVYDQSKTLADYMDGLPTEAGWTVAYEGEIVEPQAWATTKVSPFTHIVIVRIPHGGGGGGKQALRIVAMIAVAAFAAWAAPLLTGMAGIAAGTTMATVASATIGATITVAGGMVVNALLPATAGMKSGKEESATYGIDGPKNTAKEAMATTGSPVTSSTSTPAIAARISTSSCGPP